jgi:hypothetical protein
MSLERIYKRAVRDIKKRDKSIATHSAVSQAQQEAVMKASKVSEAKRFPEAPEGIRCRTCGVKYTGSMPEHIKGH